MKSNTLPSTPLGLLVGATFLILLGGCVSDPPNRYGGYRSGPPVHTRTVVVYEDDYDYYPAYEVYYSRNRREYVYRDRDQWIRRSEPSGISLNVLLASPSVRVDFRDAPERHHDTVVRTYPRNWRGSEHRQDNKNERRNDKEDRKDRKDDDKNDRKDDRR